MEKEHKSLTELIKSNKIASTSASAFLHLGGAALCAASNINIGFSLLQNPVLQNPTAQQVFIGLMGVQGVAAIMFGYKSVLKFVDLGQILQEDSLNPVTVKPKMR